MLSKSVIGTLVIVVSLCSSSAEQKGRVMQSVIVRHAITKDRTALPTHHFCSYFCMLNQNSDGTQT